VSFLASTPAGKLKKKSLTFTGALYIPIFGHF